MMASDSVKKASLREDRLLFMRSVVAGSVFLLPLALLAVYTVLYQDLICQVWKPLTSFHAPVASKLFLLLVNLSTCTGVYILYNNFIIPVKLACTLIIYV